jgi:drug/metabolite transporter (DMT)-like permease
MDMTVHRLREQRLGILLVAVSALCWSTAGFFTRLIAADAFTTLFWRGVFGGLFIAAFALWQFKGQARGLLRAMDARAWLVTACSAMGMIAFIPALKSTSVANVAIVYATVPFVAAAVAWVWLRESTSARTLRFSAMCFCGVALAVGGSSMDGGRWGDLLALLMTLAMAVMMVMLRRYRTVPLLPMACVSNLLGSLLVMPFAAPLSVLPAEIGYLALFGFVQMSLGLTVFSIGSRLIPPAQAGLIGAIETPLAPLWVWLACGEKPHVAAIVGGVVVLIAVLGHTIADIDPRAGQRVRPG